MSGIAPHLAHHVAVRLRVACRRRLDEVQVVSRTDEALEQLRRHVRGEHGHARGRVVREPRLQRGLVHRAEVGGGPRPRREDALRAACACMS